MSQIVDLFYSTTPNCTVVFPDGSVGNFVGGQYATSRAAEIYCLDKEIENGHPSLYRKPEALQMDAALLDPYEAIKRKVIAEAIAAGEIQKTTSSTSEQAPLKPASTADLLDTKTPEELLLQAGVVAKEVDFSSLLKKA